ncbi:ABC transporter substrate-binding protein [Paracoccus sp. SCSIO 75233]|uniref:ABC transporter substrate-binding protein n=1 Tax=Paracoccus sp. SCSIO 75233 TaxID=3017782 RepID=UPI0022F100A9|nr:ABC transporter substrate-binding protein [Paracoccus sp. SCSIO 75233]WBU53762.1 ABC transporter substrate-binding protein [Paracoccus sp. SCSIO 75233]
MKTPILAAAVALAATAVSAQNMPEEVTEPVTITFYNYNLSSAGNGADATKKMIAEFEEANPNIKVEGVPVSAQNLVTRVQADIVAGQSVDLSQMVFSSLDFAAQNLGAQALEDIVPAEEMAEHFEGMVPNGLALGKLDGKTYGLAYTFSTPVLFYNADIFREAGLDPENPPKTWAEIKEMGLQIKEKTGKLPLATGIFGPSALDWLMQGVIRSNGGAVINDDRTQMTFAEPEAVEAIEMLRDLAKNGVMQNLDLTSQMDTMAAGNVAMYLQTSALQGFLVNSAEGNFELRASTMPSFGDKPVRPNNSGSALVIHSTDPVKQRAAWELMKFLTSKHGYTIITSEIGYLPLRLDIVDDPEYLGNWVKEHPLVQPNLDQLSVLEPWVPMPGPNYLQIQVSMMDALEEATFGNNDDVQGILSAAQEQAQNLIP